MSCKQGSRLTERRFSPPLTVILSCTRESIFTHARTFDAFFLPSRSFSLSWLRDLGECRRAWLRLWLRIFVPPTLERDQSNFVSWPEASEMTLWFLLMTFDIISSWKYRQRQSIQQQFSHPSANNRNWELLSHAMLWEEERGKSLWSSGIADQSGKFSC